MPTNTFTPTLTFTPTNTSTQTPTFTSTNTSTATTTRTITPAASLSLSFIETSTATYRIWPQYIHTVYGFSFAAPPEWKVSELSTNFIQLSPSATPDIKFTIGVRWADEDVRIQRTGVPEGDIVWVGEVPFLGQEISKGILEYHSRDKAILYANGTEIRVGERVFTLGLSDFSIDYDSIDLTNILEETADAIVESFAITE